MSKSDIHSTFLHFVDNLENHKSGLVNEHGKEARTALEKGDYNLAKHYLDKGHDLSRHFDRIHTAASLLTKSKDDDAVTHAKDSLLNLHSGYFKKAQHHLDLATDFHNEKSKDSVAESNESNPESMADYHHSEVKPSKTGEIYAKSKGPTTTSVKPSGTSTHIKAGKTGEEYEDVKNMSQDKYTKLAEAAFGSLNQNNPFRSAPLNREVEQMVEGDVIQFPSKPKPTSTKPSKVITTATRRPAGPRPVKENLNQRFPGVEGDIAAIMKESYKKKKMMEDATNMHITTPEQREDWLNVGRGAMDVIDYINKYKV